MKQTYIEKNFTAEREAEIRKINSIIREYQNQGYVLTVRQLYYQLVARDYVENTIQSYKRVANLINDAKLAGWIDWDMIEDRTRSFVRNNHWRGPSSILRVAASSYDQDRWANQDCRVFVIIEKEALTGVLQGLCSKWDVPLLAARGYPSGSVLREFAVDHIVPTNQQHRMVHILHLGDHDPSGIDMSRDLRERLELFTGADVHPMINLERIALNMEQIEELRPPENPAKSTDSRYKEYRRQFGESSWELDALNPSYLNNLVEVNIQSFVDHDVWQDTDFLIEEARRQLNDVADDFEAREQDENDEDE